MAFGRSRDEELEAGPPGRYDAEIYKVTTGGRLTRHLNERWAEGWRLLRTEQNTAGTLVLFWERAT